MKATHQFVNCCGLELHLTCWGDPSLPAIVMWHGLTRTGRDFDELAQGLAHQYYVFAQIPSAEGCRNGVSNLKKNM